jgi:hypothetical protein
MALVLTESPGASDSTVPVSSTLCEVESCLDFGGRGRGDIDKGRSSESVGTSDETCGELCSGYPVSLYH